LFVRVCINVCVCVYNVISPPRKEAVHMHTIFFVVYPNVGVLFIIYALRWWRRPPPHAHERRDQLCDPLCGDLFILVCNTVPNELSHLLVIHPGLE
jgi:hypothetical protein